MSEVSDRGSDDVLESKSNSGDCPVKLYGYFNVEQINLDRVRGLLKKSESGCFRIKYRNALYDMTVSLDENHEFTLVLKHIYFNGGEVCRIVHPYNASLCIIHSTFYPADVSHFLNYWEYASG